MNQLSSAPSWAWVPLGLSFAAAGCVVAAAGAGAGGGIYFTKRGVESVVPASVERAFAATTRAFEHFKIRQTKLKAEDEDKDEDQDEGEKRPVTWDKDFARAVLEKVVAYSR